MTRLVSEDFQRHLALMLSSRRDVPGEHVEELSAWIADSVAAFRIYQEMELDSRSVVGPGRPYDINLAILENRVLGGLAILGIKPTKAEEGTFARILEYVYAELGLSGRDAFKAARQAFKLVSRPRRKKT